MFKIDSNDKYLIKFTRGDIGQIIIRKKIKDETDRYEPFFAGDKVIFTIKNNFADEEVLLRKIVEVIEDCDYVIFDFSSEDTTIGDLIAAPMKYQYDVSIDGDKTIIGYDDETGPKYVMVYPEGSNDI